MFWAQAVLIPLIHKMPKKKLQTKNSQDSQVIPIFHAVSKS